MQTVQIMGNSYFISRYENTAFTGAGVIRVWVEGQGLAASDDPPNLWFVVCALSVAKDCTMEAAGLDNG